MDINIKDAVDAIKAVIEQRNEAIQLLLDNEWGGMWGKAGKCSTCGALQENGHGLRCPVGNFLKRASE